MPIKRLSQTSLASFQKHSNMLAGNPAFIPSSFDLLETTVLSSTATSVTFSSLGSYSDYKHLQLRIVVRESAAFADNDTMTIRFNGDTGNNYAYHRLNGNGSSVSSTGEINFSSIPLGDLVPAGSTTANNFGAAVVDILDFGSSNKNTTIRALYGATNSSESDIMLLSGAWFNTAAVTSITCGITNTAIAGSRFSLYGIK